MDNTLKSAVILSILSTPSKLGLWDSLSLHPCDILEKIDIKKSNILETIAVKYSEDADKTSDLIIEKCIRKKITIVTIWDNDYPLLLKEIHNPPLVLYLKGTIGEGKKISIVGTRNSDEKSEKIAKKISSEASAAGYTIVSGMAIGIDRNAHLGALMCGGGTIAVLPGGIDFIYPAKNIDIYRLIEESASSAAVSEYPPGIGIGQKWTFARRNRIISGLSEAVIVIQAPSKSGALITAGHAIEQNRELFVCPGNAFDDTYSGCNELIKQGANIFSDMNDLFSGLETGCGSLKTDLKYRGTTLDTKKTEMLNNTEKETVQQATTTGKVEKKILDELEKSTVEIDEFIRRNRFSADEVNKVIVELEIGGIIERKGFIIRRL